MRDIASQSSQSCCLFRIYFALKPRIANAAKDLNRSEDVVAPKRFRSYFNLRELAQGAEFVFSREGSY
jgi:hypothetical protein